MHRIPNPDGSVPPPSRHEIWAALDRDERRLLWRAVGVLFAYVALLALGVLLWA